jgi:hypothetical protein
LQVPVDGSWQPFWQQLDPHASESGQQMLPPFASCVHGEPFVQQTPPQIVSPFGQALQI